MNDFNSFVKQFTDEKISGVTKVKRKYFLVEESAKEFAKKINRDPYVMGMLLAEKTREFKPTPALLDLIAKVSDKKVFISEQAEWLFLCGRDVFSGSITKAQVNRGLVLVQNSKDENLGYGLIKGRGKNISVNHILDKGDYLRREKH